MNKFVINPADTFIWNEDELIKFLINFQNSDIVIDTNGEGYCCKSIGLYKLLDAFKFNSVTILTSNLLEYHPTYSIDINTSSAVQYVELSESVDYSAYHNWNSKTIFGAWYNRASWHRIGLAAHLYHKATTLNFRYDPHDEDRRVEFEIQQLFIKHPESLKEFMLVYDKFPIQLENKDGFTMSATTVEHTNQLVKFYQDFLIDIVAETFTTGRTFFLTEKTIRPMLLKKPMIVMGPRNCLQYLKQMGFKTFNECWNEDYDGYDTKDRYLKILKLIDELSTKSRTELIEMYRSMSEILDHNYELLMTRNYSADLTYLP